MNWNLPSIVRQVSTAVFAQATSSSAVAPGKEMAVDWVRIAGFILTVLVIFLLTFYVIYPATLRRAIQVMPRTLYGRCLAFFLITIEGLFLALFLKHFVWGDPLVDFNRNWPKVAWIGVMLLSVIAPMGLYRSPSIPKLEAVGKSASGLKTAKS